MSNFMSSAEDSSPFERVAKYRGGCLNCVYSLLVSVSGAFLNISSACSADLVMVGFTQF